MEFQLYQFFWHLVFASSLLLGGYGIIFYFKTKLNSFLWYALICWLIFLSNLIRDPYKIVPSVLINPYYRWNTQIAYNLFYFLFFISFLNTKKHLPKFTKIIQKFVVILLIFTFLSNIISILNNDSHYLYYFYYLFAFTTVVFAIIGFFVIWKIPDKLKFYLILGSSVYIVGSISSLYFSYYLYKTKRLISEYWILNTPIIFFYIGVLFEQITFGFGLAHKVSLIQKDVLRITKEKIQLKSKMNLDLEEQLQAKTLELAQTYEAIKKNEMIQLKSDFEAEITETKLAGLRAQMNPHFIFNALNSIKYFMIENNTVKAVHFLNRFAQLIRMILKSSRVESWLIHEEIQILKLYTEIENNRFNNEIEFYIDEITEEIKPTQLPPIILQPFVENAIWHGLAASSNVKKLSIKFHLKERKLIYLSITDNGVGRKNNFLNSKSNFLNSDSIGLNLTQNRIKLFNKKFNTNYSYEIIDLNQGVEIQFWFVKKS
ncbi:histidine kinase [Polaribacter sp. Z022]|uniref:histidine kinase n=1 Tax=Polaribacter sp. Z022 TaxID=2927125 RepID=UPI0020227314|nr:histidine kinase [Polaribacter sp. Z022]MCL7753727.1 histidine kinase [Polaribacter sp. Z022]